MKIKVSELGGTDLDRVVAGIRGTLGQKPARCFDCKYHNERTIRDGSEHDCLHPDSNDLSWCVGWPSAKPFGDGVSADSGTHVLCPINTTSAEPYSSDWGVAGPVIEAEEIQLRKVGISTWRATIDLEEGDALVEEQDGPSQLIAAMRAYVASELGDAIEIPSEE